MEMERETMKRTVLVLRCLAVLLLVSATQAGAQTTTGAILGTVRDGTGGVIPRAEVVVTNLGTNYSRRALTDDVGQYLFRELPVGGYRVEVTANGFKTFVQTGVVLEVNRHARVDVTLQLGAETETVNVEADAPLVETTVAALGRTVQQKEILNLPLVNRNVYSLLALTAGVDDSQQATGSGQAFGYPAQITVVNGSADSGQGAVNYFLDGGTNTNGLRGYGNVAPNPDAVQEFRVLTNSFSAEYGRYGGGAVDVITKSGTNRLHGSAFEFNRSDSFNATPWKSLTKDPLSRNQFGATLGGPLQKDKSFFFVSYSGLRQTTTVSANSAVLPTAAELAGDFRSSAKKLNSKYPDGRIPATSFDPTALAIIDYLGLPAMTPSPNLTGNRIEIKQERPRDEDELQLKVNRFAGAHQLAASWFFWRQNDSAPLAGNLPWTVQEFRGRQHNLNLSDTWIVGPKVVNSLRLTYVRQMSGRFNSPEKALGEFGSGFMVQGKPSLPQIQVSGYFNLNTTIDGTNAGSNLYALRDVLGIAKGRHALKVGGEISLEKMLHYTNLNNYGTFSFDGTKTGNAFADFLTGVPVRMNQDAPVLKANNAWYFTVFAQDDFRLSDRLTLNLGLRYDLQLAPTDPQDRMVTFVTGRQSTVAPTAPLGLLFPGDAGVGRGIMKTDKNNLAPRLGFAWDPAGNGKTAVRGGFGVFYGSVSGNEWNSSTDNQPFTIRQQFNDVYSLTDPYRNLPGAASPFPYVYSPENPRFLFPSAIYGPGLHVVMPYTYQMNLSVQRELVPSLSVSVAYVGALGRKLPLSPDLNYPELTPGASTKNVDSRRPYYLADAAHPNGTYSRINLIQSIASTDYHGMQVTIEKRGQRFTLNGYYSFGKALDSADLGQNTIRGSGTTFPAQNSTKLDAERGRTGTDRRHNLVLAAIWKLDYLQDSNRLLHLALDGWTVSAVGSLRSGLGNTILTGTDVNLDGQNYDRANVVADWRIEGDRSREEKAQQWFSTAAFAAPASGQDGDTGRNIVDGPWYHNLDLGLFRDFKLGQTTLQVRAEATNVLNMVRLNNPVTNMNNTTTFGQILSAAAMRQIQLGARLSF